MGTPRLLLAASLGLACASSPKPPAEEQSQARPSASDEDGLSSAAEGIAPASLSDPFRDPLVQLDATALRAQIADGQRNPESLLQATLARVEAHNERGLELRALLWVDKDATPQPGLNPDAPLFGLPIALKDNIDQAGVPTTAGSLALVDNRPTVDAPLTAALREAGAVLFAKANLSEWANFRSSPSSSGWSAVGGQTRNPHRPDYSPCGSSSGSGAAVAFGFAAAAIGTETDGSILCPAAINGIAGLKPTVGLISRAGIVPISPAQDTAGPMARSVRDLALLLSVLAKAPATSQDKAALERPTEIDQDYLGALDPKALEGVRLAIAPGLVDFAPGTRERFAEAQAQLKAAGAELVEWTQPWPKEADSDEWEVLCHEFEPALNAYLAQTPAEVGVRSLEALIAFNKEKAEQELVHFGQAIFEECQGRPTAAQRRYEKARKRSRAIGAGWLQAELDRLDAVAMIGPTTDPSWLIDHEKGDAYGASTTSYAAVPGYPALTVPMGRVNGLPVGLSFIGRAWDESRLLGLAFAYESLTAPAATPRGP